MVGRYLSYHLCHNVNKHHMKTTETNIINNYPQPSPALIDEIRKRLADVPNDVLERAHHAFMHHPIQDPASILYKAGVCLSSHELYEYRKTLFPPNALLDPVTQGPPVLLNLDTGNPSSSIQHPASATHSSINPTIQPSSDPVAPLTCRRNGLGLEDTEPWSDPVDGAALLDELRQTLRRYVVLPGMAPETLALWVLHTYAFELRNVSTYIGLGSPQKRCGKTTLLSVLTELVSRPVVASNISPPALFRAIEEARPTLLIDEADTFLQANDEMRGILNSGYTRKTAYVLRVQHVGPVPSPGHGRAPASDRPLTSELVRFSCWCPKVIAAIGRLPDTLLDRCIPITMQRKTPEEACERLRHLDGQALRRKCARFIADHTRDIATAKPDMPTQLNDRAADIWEPLLVIADLAGSAWPKLARDAALQMSAGMPDSTVIGSLLIDILTTFIQEDVERIPSRDLVDSLNAFLDRPWAEARKCKEIDGLWLAQQLRPYGVRPKAIWLDGKTVKGYVKSDFEEVWPRYVSRSDVDALLADRGVSDQVGRAVPSAPHSDEPDQVGRDVPVEPSSPADSVATLPPSQNNSSRNANYNSAVSQLANLRPDIQRDDEPTQV